MHTSREKSLPRQGGAGEAGAGVEEPVPEGGRGGLSHTVTEPVVADRGAAAPPQPPKRVARKQGKQEKARPLKESHP